MYKTPYVFLLMDGRRERFMPAREEWNAITEGDSVLLETGKGILGFEFAFRFKPH